METIKYRKIVVLGRIFFAWTFVLGSIFLILASIFLEAPLYRKILSVVAAAAGFWLFGRIFILLHFLFFKNPTMLRYDSENVYVKDRVISRKNIRKIDMTGNAPTGFLGLKSPAYVIHCFDQEKIIIPTYYVLTKKDETRITKSLKKYTSQKVK